MKGKLTLLVLLAVVAGALWFGSRPVAEGVSDKGEFALLWEAAGAARAGEPLYGEGYRQAPYVAVMFIPLRLAQTIGSAAVGWYWANVALVLVAMFLSTYVLSGKWSVGKNGMFLVPALAVLVVLLFFLPSGSLAALALVFVLGGLCCFRRKWDIPAGLLTSLALFSPLGIAFAAYYALKLSWKALLGFAIGAVVLFGILPMGVFGVKGGGAQVGDYFRQGLRPAFSGLGGIQAPPHKGVAGGTMEQSMWTVLPQHFEILKESTYDRWFAEPAEAGGSSGQEGQEARPPDAPGPWPQEIIVVTERSVPAAVPPAAPPGEWMLPALVLAGAIVLLTSVFGVWRKLPERAMPIVGLEGALVVLAVLILAPQIRVETLVIAIFPLAAVVYVIRHTELRRLVHHVSYVGLVLAVAGFYLLLDTRLMAFGSGFAGVLILWIVTLWAINRFRPQIVKGRLATSFEPRPAALLEKPVELARVHTEAEKEPQFGEGLRAMPDFGALASVRPDVPYAAERDRLKVDLSEPVEPHDEPEEPPEEEEPQGDKEPQEEAQEEEEPQEDDEASEMPHFGE